MLQLIKAGISLLKNDGSVEPKAIYIPSFHTDYKAANTHSGTMSTFSANPASLPCQKVAYPTDCPTASRGHDTISSNMIGQNQAESHAVNSPPKWSLAAYHGVWR